MKTDTLPGLELLDELFGLPEYTLHGSVTNVGEEENEYFELMPLLDDQNPIICGMFSSEVIEAVASLWVK